MLCIYPTYSFGQTISNSDFEEEFYSWEKTNNTTLFEILDTDSKEGSKSAMLSNISNSSYGIEQIIIDIQPEEYYEFAVFSKTTDLNTAKIFMRIAWYESTDASGSQIKTIDSESVVQPNWTQIKTVVQSPRTAHSAKIRLLVSAGHAYFDDATISLAPSPTPTQTPIHTPTPTYADIEDALQITNIYISEGMVHPLSGEPEWIELFNNNAFEVTISDWYIDDIEDGGAAPKSFSIQIPAFSYATHELSSSIFNNNSDEIRLLNEEKKVIDSISYSASIPGFSIGKTPQKSWCNQLPSKNKPNNSCYEPSVTSTVTPTNILPTLQSKVLGKTANPLTPTKILKVIDNMLPTPTVLNKESNPQSDEESIEILPSSATQVETKPWLLLSGSYSFLATVSLVSKLIFFRYT